MKKKIKEICLVLFLILVISCGSNEKQQQIPENVKKEIESINENAKSYA